MADVIAPASDMTGAECLLRTLAANGVDICFMNPGTSEIQFVAALERVRGGSRWLRPDAGQTGGDVAAPEPHAPEPQAPEQSFFAPPVAEVYPPGFSTQVRISGPLTETLEGAHRGAQHFHGVTTVVTKLLNMVGPDVALFG